MSYNIDTIIFIGFLAITLFTGLKASQGVTNIRQYAIGDKTFTTPVLVSTIVATWVSGEFFFTGLMETYQQGIGLALAITIGDFIVLFAISYFFAPRMHEFQDKISIADAMGQLFGNKVRLVTVFAGIILASGIIAIQLQIAGTLFEFALGLSSFYGIIISGLVITVYSALGGIKSVTFTDYLQFIMFGVVIPMITLYLNELIPTHDMIIDTLSTHESFNLSYVLSFQNPNIYYFISIFIWSCIPSFNPAVFQRVVMAKDARQIKDSFAISAFICSILLALVCWMGVLAVTSFGDIKSGNLFITILDQVSLSYGFKGLLLAGILAMVMSTVDSYINSTSVLIVYDTGQVLKQQNKSSINNDLFLTKICSVVVGVLSILFAMRSGSFLDLFLWVGMFYMPVVTIPFIMAVFGFRSSEKTVLIAMVVGFTTAMVWESYFKIANVGGVVPGMLANLITLFAAHYLLRQPGGWIEGSIEPKKNIRVNILTIYQNVKGFKAIDFLKTTTPKTDGLIFALGAFVVLSTISLINIFKPLDLGFSIYRLYFIVLLFSSFLMAYPLVKPKIRNDLFLPIIWNSAIFGLLICFSFFTVLISKFSSVPVIIFMVNIIVIFSLLGWRVVFFYLIIGLFLVGFLYKNVITMSTIEAPGLFTEFKIIYILSIISGAVIVFLKPKEDEFSEAEYKVADARAKAGIFQSEALNYKAKAIDSEAKAANYKIKANDFKERADHFSEKINLQNKEIERLGATAQRILNNLNHELRLPVGNVMNFAEMLNEGLGKYSNEQLKELSDEVYKNSNRLSSMILNMLDLATLSAQKLEINRQSINFGELIEERIERCRKIYLQNKPVIIKPDIAPNLIISVDTNYMKQVVDNLLINAMNFSKEGTIKITARAEKTRIIMQIEDEGIGIPKSEIYDIFTPFKMGSNVATKAEGRGVGLALCKAAVEAHNGKIEAKSRAKGAVFIVTLPIV